MTTSPADRLRREISESIPSGGSADETLFTDAEIQDLLDDHVLFESAVRKGWELKRKRVGDLVDTAEGGSRRQLSQLYDRAVREYDLALIAEKKAMVDNGIPLPDEGTKIGKIARPRRAADLPSTTEYGGTDRFHPWHYPYPFRRRR